jgi:hypothetical protein
MHFVVNTYERITFFSKTGNKIEISYKLYDH